MSTAENKRIAETFIDGIFNKGILERVNGFVTTNFTYHVRGEDITGTENFTEWVSSDRSIFPDIHYTILR